MIENAELSHANDEANSVVRDENDFVNNNGIGDNNDNNNKSNNDINNVGSSNGSNHNRDNDRHGIAECSAVCLDGQPTMIIENDTKLDAENNLLSEYFENSETDDIVDNRTVQNTAFEKDDSVQGQVQVKNTVTDSIVRVGEAWIDSKGVVCVKKAHKNNNNTSRIVSQQKRYQEYHSQKFQLKELDIAKKLTESILKTEFEVPVSPLLCSLSISPPYTPTRKREYLVPDAASKEKLKSEISNENLNDKTKITNILNDVSESDDYNNIDVENFHREFEAKYRRNVTTTLGRSNTDSDDGCINIRSKNESNKKTDNHNNDYVDKNNNDNNDQSDSHNDHIDNNNNDDNINDDNNDDTISSAPLCVGPLKISSLSAVAAEEVVWAELTRLGDGSKVLEIYSMTDQKAHNISTKNVDINSKNTNINTNAEVSSSGGGGLGGSGCDEKEKENDGDNGSSCSMLLVASYTIVPDSYRVISKQRSRQAVDETTENDMTNGNEENNSDDSESQHTFIRNCDSVGGDDRGGQGLKVAREEDEKEKGKKDGKGDDGNTNQLKLLDTSSLTTAINKHSQELGNKSATHTDHISTSSKEEDKIFTAITYGFEIFNPHEKGDVRIRLQHPSSSSSSFSNVATTYSNVQVTEKMEKKIVEEGVEENMIRTSPTYVKIGDNETDKRVDDDDDDSVGTWMLFWCETESDCAEWMLSLRSA